MLEFDQDFDKNFPRKKTQQIPHDPVWLPYIERIGFEWECVEHVENQVGDQATADRFFEIRFIIGMSF